MDTVKLLVHLGASIEQTGRDNGADVPRRRLALAPKAPLRGVLEHPPDTDVLAGFSRKPNVETKAKLFIYDVSYVRDLMHLTSNMAKNDVNSAE